MHNREITHIVKINSILKTQLIVRTPFCCHLRETYVKTKKINKYENTMQKLDLRLKQFNFFNYLPLFEYKGEFMTVNQKYPTIFFINLLPN